MFYLLFFNKEKAPKSLETALIFSGGLVVYKEDRKQNISYNILQLCTHDLETEKKKKPTSSIENELELRSTGGLGHLG
jgi:hypothetical protein